MEKRFWNKVDTKTKEECWEWKCGKDKDGYGCFYLGKNNVRAHRIAYELYNKKQIENGLIILHNCDNPSCCNPHHLSEGTYKDNHNDCVNKKRKAVGMRLSNSKLTDNDIIEIRNKYSSDNYTLLMLSEEYSVSQARLSLIVRKKCWRHIE